MERGKSQNIVGAVCRRLRKEHGWKQHEFIVHCQLLGWALSRETLAKIESGVRRVNDAEVALLARALDTTADALLAAPMEQLLPTARHSPDIPDEDSMAAEEAQ
ncbi:MAG: helix-turn-helix domain-containing protein [Akkermansia sp.]|nr:helix-turn-helix domain-containing protein [Akkermansia sp.]